MKGIVLKMALRNVLEHRRKSLTVGLIVAAASFLFTLGFSILDTASAGIRKEYRDRVTGDLYITARTPSPLTVFGWKDMNEMGTEIPRLGSHAALKAFAESLAAVESATSRALGLAQMTNDADASKLGFGMVMGVDTATYTKVFPNALRLTSGKPWADGEKGIVVSDMASSGLSGSSIMMISPPRPVSVPPTDVAKRNPRSVSSISFSVFLYRPIAVLGKSRRYHAASKMARKSLESFLARSPE